MEASELLLTLAEVSIAFVGFSALVFALRERRARAWSYVDSMAIRAPILIGLGALFLSLLPLFLGHTPLPEPLIWQLSSGALAITLLSLAAYYHWVRQRVAQTGEIRLRSVPYLMRQSTAIVLVLLQLLNFLNAPKAWPYLFGVAWLLIFGGLFFLRLFTIFQSTGSSDADAA